jgi:hypothetical protein
MYVMLNSPLVHCKGLGSPSFRGLSCFGDDGLLAVKTFPRFSPLCFCDSLALKSRADEPPSRVRRSLVLNAFSESLDR